MELSDLLRIFEKHGATWSWIDPENWYSKPFQHQMAQWLLWGGAEEPSEGFTAALAEALWQNALSSFVIYHKPLLRSSLGDAEKVADLHLSNRSLLQPAKAEGKNQGCILIDTLLRSVEWGNSPTGTWIAHFKDAFSIIVHSYQEGKQHQHDVAFLVGRRGCFWWAFISCPIPTISLRKVSFSWVRQTNLMFFDVCISDWMKLHFVYKSWISHSDDCDVWFLPIDSWIFSQTFLASQKMCIKVCRPKLTNRGYMVEWNFYDRAILSSMRVASLTVQPSVLESRFIIQKLVMIFTEYLQCLQIDRDRLIWIDMIDVRLMSIEID